MQSLRGLPRVSSPRSGRRSIAAGAFCGVLLLVLVACDAYEGQAIRVFDGDSFLMREAGETEIEVRLFGIDAPERYQPWSDRSRQALTELLHGQRLRLVPETEDRYGRVVATVLRVSDGLDVNAEMVRLGHAWVFRRYTDDPALIALGLRSDCRGMGQKVISKGLYQPTESG